MLVENVLQAAAPHLAGRTVKDLVIGLALIACELDNGCVGVSYVLREGLTRGPARFQRIHKLIGGPAADAAEWIVSGADNIQRAVGASVLTAASQSLDFPDDDGNSYFGIDLKPDDKVAMIGYIAVIAEQFSHKVDNLVIFDQGLPLDGSIPHLYPLDQQAALLPECDIAVISGTAAINGSIDSLLHMCANAREIVLLGPSTPMFPEGYRNTRITRLAGSFWAKGHKEEIFRAISLAGGIGSIEKFMQKKILKNQLIIDTRNLNKQR